MRLPENQTPIHTMFLFSFLGFSLGALCALGVIHEISKAR